MDEKIAQALDILYKGAEHKKQKILFIVSGMSSLAKEKMYLALYDRIESNKKNMDILNLKFQFVKNKIGDFKDKIEAERINFNI